MAKDGTNRGGRRVRAGDKPDSLNDKIAAGRAAKVLQLHNFEPETDIVGDDIGEGGDMPMPSEYLSARQKNDKPLGADEIFKETWKWLRARRCETLVSPRLVEAYSQAFARFIQCENAISQYGLLGRHPTTGGAVTSPFVTMSHTFSKQANVLWYEIFEIVKQNCTGNYISNPYDDTMERYYLSDNRRYEDGRKTTSSRAQTQGHQTVRAQPA